MENKIWQWLVKTWNALTGKISLAVQIASMLSLTLVSVLVVLLIANRLGVEDSFLRLLGILFSPTLVICAAVLYLWRRHESHIGGFLGRITKLDVGPFRALAQPNKTIDPILSRGKSGDKSEDGASNAATSPDEIQKKAEEGDAEAQFDLGVLYDYGEGAKQNRVKAAEWYRLAAEQGHAKAQFNLGVLHYNGEGVKQNRVEAAKWYRLAAEQKIAAAQFNLGILYSEGEGVKQSQPEAAKWLRLAAEQGIAKAQSALGVVYYIGKGIEQNHAEAAKWFRLAAEQEIDRAQFNLGILYRNGEGVAQSYSEAYIWFSLASTGNDPEARKARDQMAQKLDWNAMKDAQAEATRRAEKIRRKREGESQ